MLSTPWKHKRLEILYQQNNECQVCKANGLYSKADTVHHIKYLRKHPELALTDSNLMALCDNCHFEIHHKNKPKLQLNEEKW
ncbi:MAG TPA: HNH endonuclease [Clostridium sp.]|nr:HNH endonuclease [Clostridium sp.]